MVTWPHSVDDIGGFLITWLPIVFFGIIIWLLLRTMALVPKVKPAMVDRDTTDPVGWDDVEAVVGLLAPGGTAVLDDFWNDPSVPDPRRDSWRDHPLLTTIELWVTPERRAIVAVRR